MNLMVVTSEGNWSGKESASNYFGVAKKHTLATLVLGISWGAVSWEFVWKVPSQVFHKSILDHIDHLRNFQTKIFRLTVSLAIIDSKPTSSPELLNSEFN